MRIDVKGSPGMWGGVGEKGRLPLSDGGAVGRAVEPYALTRCDVHFVLVVDGSERMNAPATKDQLERIRVVLGSAAEGLVPFAGGAGPIEVSGFAERPGSVRKRGRHWLMVNSRPVDDRSLRHALLAGYRGQIPREMFPTAVIFLRVPPERLDVNVHPAKSEVRFADQQAIYNSLTAAIGSAFGSGSLRDSAAKLDADLEAPAQTALPIKDGVTLPPSSGYFAVPTMEAEPAVRIGDIQILGQLFETYIIARDVQGLLIADQHAAHEKIIYQRLMNLRGGGIRQNLLVPATLELAASEASLLQKCRPALENLGFEMEEFGGRSFVIRSAPADTQDRDIPDLIRQVLSEVEESGRVPAEFDLARRVCASMACHLAVKAGKRLASREMEALVRELLALSDPLCCPHGRPTLMRLDASQLSRTFRRPPG